MTFLPVLLLFVVLVGKTGASDVHSETSSRMLNADPTERINQCKVDPATKVVIDEMLALQALTAITPAWIMPIAEGFGDSFFPTIGNQPLSGPNVGLLPIPPNSNYTERYQWLANKLPFRYDELNAEQYPGLPPNYDPANPYANQLPFFWHETEDVSTWGHKKFPAVPVCITSFVGFATGDFRSESPGVSIFSTNLEDRGVDNEQKRQYMSALTCDKLSFYESKVDRALDALVTDIDASGQPVISSWFDRVVTLFLDLHFGAVNHPDYVRTYFLRMFGVISDLNGVCNPLDPDLDQIYSGYCEVQLVQEYIEERVKKIITEQDKSTLIFWWNKAGLPTVSLIQEAVHNSLAFGQWVNTLYLILAAKVQGYLMIASILEPPVDPPPKEDLFAAYEQASTDAERLNVARESFRLLLPANLWQSALESSSTNNTGKALNDPTLSRSATSHIPIFLQSLNDNYNNQTGETTVGTFDTNRYTDFDATQMTCPFLKNNLLTPDTFSVSAVDAETMIPAGHEKLIPVFPSPKYCPFGLGYRRCPAEMLNYMFMEKVLDKLGHLEFEVLGGGVLTPRDLARGVWRDNPEFEKAIPAGLVRRPDDIYVKRCSGDADEACSEGYTCSCNCA